MMFGIAVAAVAVAVAVAVAAAAAVVAVEAAAAAAGTAAIPPQPTIRTLLKTTPAPDVYLVRAETHY